jgi:hypothetical protein
VKKYSYTHTTNLLQCSFYKVKKRERLVKEEKRRRRKGEVRERERSGLNLFLSLSFTVSRIYSRREKKEEIDDDTG